MKPGDLVRPRARDFIGFPTRWISLWSTDHPRTSKGSMDRDEIALVLSTYELHVKILLGEGIYMISRMDVEVIS